MEGRADWTIDLAVLAREMVVEEGARWVSKSLASRRLLLQSLA